jgi:hypothetical protein
LKADALSSARTLEIKPIPFPRFRLSIRVSDADAREKPGEGTREKMRIAGMNSSASSRRSASISYRLPIAVLPSGQRRTGRYQFIEVGFPMAVTSSATVIKNTPPLQSDILQ